MSIYLLRILFIKIVHALTVQTWRLIDTDLAHPYYVTAADDAISRAISEGKVPDTLHFYRRHPPGVSVGRMQSVKDIDLEECRKRGIVIVRRRSGGGTIYTDEGCLIYALIFRSDTTNPEKIFGMVCNSIRIALEEFGFNAEYKKPNDILVNGRKVSGSALLVRGDVVLIHGTVIVSSDLDVMKKVLIKRKEIEVTSLEREGKKVDFKELKEMLIKRFGESMDAEFVRGGLSDYEKKLIERLIEEGYGRDEWNFMR